MAQKYAPIDMLEQLIVLICLTSVHDPDYRQSWNDWTSFVDALSEKIAEIDGTVPELPPKDLVFRIYRDVRFSPDPTPYKAHFSAAWYGLSSSLRAYC